MKNVCETPHAFYGCKMYDAWELPGQAKIRCVGCLKAQWTTSYGVLDMLTVTSCPGDPLHPGHISAIRDNTHTKGSWDYITLVKAVIVNCDKFLELKKGAAFIPHKVRCQIISALRGVDYVIPWNVEYSFGIPDMTVCKPLEMLKPNYFTKGGDRKDAQSIPEWQTCEDNGIKLITGCGDDKVWSSSNFLADWVKKNA